MQRGGRIVQIYFGNGQLWDSHEDILVHQKLTKQADKPMTALLKDLKARGLLNETIVICGSEIGRTAGGREQCWSSRMD